VSVFFFFFFSSRRRHTRSKRDWSSDVCSSDLVVDAAPAPGVAPEACVGVLRIHQPAEDKLGFLLPVRRHGDIIVRLHAGIDAERSEEHTSELQSRFDLVCRLLLEKKKK